MKVASIQANVAFGNPLVNAQRAVDELGRLALDDVKLAVFPECFLTGYCVDSAEAAASIAISRADAVLTLVQRASDSSGTVAVIGFAEVDGDNLYNTVALFEPGCEPRYYRKTHLPFLGYDRFAKTGDDLPVFDTSIGRVGIQICFDQRFPEPSRALALAGAELILIPTNWPVGAEVSADIMCIARAAENRVWVITANRVGLENGFDFIGRSKIISPTGALLASAAGGDSILVADIDVAQARVKRTVTIPGKYETDVFEPRRPDLYDKVR